jgi:hypothetical protein
MCYVLQLQVEMSPDGNAFRRKDDWQQFMVAAPKFQPAAFAPPGVFTPGAAVFTPGAAVFVPGAGSGPTSPEAGGAASAAESADEQDPDDLGFEFDEDLQAKEAAKPAAPTASDLAKKVLLGSGGATSGNDSDWDSELDDADIERVVMFVHTPDRHGKQPVKNDRTASVNSRQSKKLDWADQIDMELRHYERVSLQIYAGATYYAFEQCLFCWQVQ